MSLLPVRLLTKTIFAFVPALGVAHAGAGPMSAARRSSVMGRRMRMEAASGVSAEAAPTLSAAQDVPAVLGRVDRRSQRAGALTRLALAAGEVEVGLELARVALELPPHELERVRLEQVAQVDVGQAARVRR